MPEILLTGGTGRLGRELVKHISVKAVGRKDFDFTKPIVKLRYKLIIHAGAYTDVKKAETEKFECFQTNVFGTFNMVQSYKNTPFVYISTEYANKPIGVYALSKYLGEEIVKIHPHHLIIRTIFKPNPFPFPEAYINQYTQGDYVDIIAKLIAEAIKKWNKSKSKLIYVGTGRKTMYALAKRTRPDVKPNRVEDYTKKTGVPIPKDYR